MKASLTVVCATLLCAAVHSAPQSFSPDPEGFVRNWLVLAPIAIEGDQGASEIDKDFLRGEAAIAPKAGDKVTVGARQLTWQAHQTSDFFIDFLQAFGKEQGEYVAAYAVAYVIADVEMKVTLSASSNDQGKAWINGKEIFRFAETRTLEKDTDKGDVTLVKGQNVLVLKVVNEVNNWQGCVRFTQNGVGVKNIRISLTPQQEARSSQERKKLSGGSRGQSTVGRRPHVVLKGQGHMKRSTFQQFVFISTAIAAAAAATVLVAGQATAPQGAGQPQAGVPATPTGAPTPGAQAPGAGRGGGATQWGRGPIRVAVVTKGHNFGPREEFYQMWDSFGTDITWTSVEHPAAEVLLSPKYSDLFDVYAFYDVGGTTGTSTTARGGGPAPVVPPGAKVVGNRFFPQPPAYFKQDFPALLKQGDKGFVFLHHSNASWVQVWPEYSEVVGSACDWGSPTTVRGLEHPPMGFFGNTAQKFTVVDKTHPITKDLSDFEFSDESYNCAFFEDSVHPLVRTDFKPADPARNLNPKMPVSNLSAYVKTAENSPVFYAQMGHGAAAWSNPAYRQLVLNGIKWAASPEAKAWAKANPKKIFK
jgi:hypothetical protein